GPWTRELSRSHSNLQSSLATPTRVPYGDSQYPIRLQVSRPHAKPIHLLIVCVAVLASNAIRGRAQAEGHRFARAMHLESNDQDQRRSVETDGGSREPGGSLEYPA